MNETNSIIEAVKSFPLLYNLSHTEYKDIRKKDKVWNQLGIELHLEGEVVKRKWKNLRDSYSKYVRSLTSPTGQAYKYRHWQWAKQMEFMKPFVTYANTRANTQDTDMVINIENQQLNSQENLNSPQAPWKNEEREMIYKTDNRNIPSFISSNIIPLLKGEKILSESQSQPSSHGEEKESIEKTYNRSTQNITSENILKLSKEKKRKISENKSNVEKVIKYFRNKRNHASNLSALETLFLGYAKTIKAFTLNRQAFTKLKLAEIIIRQEFEQQQENAEPQEKMVRTYVRKTDRQIWNSEDMKIAVEEVLNKRIGFLKASNLYKVPKSTLESRVKLARKNPDKTKFGLKILGNFKPVFNEEQEKELVAYIKSMQGRLFGMSGFELRSLAFELAKRNNLEHRFNVEEGLAGKDWLRGFLKRHPDLSYRRPEPTSAAKKNNKILFSRGFDENDEKGKGSCSKDKTRSQGENIPRVKVEVMNGLEDCNDPGTSGTHSTSTFDVSEQVTTSNPLGSYFNREEYLGHVFDSSQPSVNGKKETEFDFFGKSIGVQLNNMPLNDALQLQFKIQQVITEFRLNNSRVASSSSHSTQRASARSHVSENASIEDLEIKTEYVSDSFLSE